MPNLDYAFLCDHARVDGGLAHAIGISMDTTYVPQVPIGYNLGLLARLEFTNGECGRPHRIEVLFQDTDGQTLADIQAVVTPEARPDLPTGWKVGQFLCLNFGVVLPAHGVYTFEVMINDSSAKSLPLRVIPLIPPAE